MKSELQLMKEQIELECQALRNMALPSFVASHEMIQNKHKNLDACMHTLDGLIGKEESIAIVCEIYNRVVG